MRIGFIVLTILSAALSIFLFSLQILFWYNICSINCDFCSRYHFSRSKAVDYSTAISQEINDLENQLTQLEKEYNLDFDLEYQQQVREQWRHAKK